MSKAKDHIYDTLDIVESVLRGKKATALCGYQKVITREGLDDTNQRKACKGCLNEFAVITVPGSRSTLHGKCGWVETLERAYLLAQKPPVAVYTYKVNRPECSRDFPLAA